MRLVPAIIIAIAIILAPLVWLGARALLSPGAVTSGGPAVDSAARIDIEVLRQQIEALNERLGAMETEISRLGAAPPAPLAPSGQSSVIPRTGPNQIIDAYAQVVLIANRRRVNRSLTVASPGFLEELLGRPREDLGDTCQSVTNEKIRSQLVLTQVGPVKVNMMRPAVDSLARVLQKVREVDADLHDRINTSGSLCVRRIRGTQTRLSTHAFGLAIDLNIDGQLDNFTDGKTQLGLTILADFFREEGWIWGAGFSREDSMHFEVSREKLEEWRRDGLI